MTLRWQTEPYGWAVLQAYTVVAKVRRTGIYFQAELWGYSGHEGGRTVGVGTSFEEAQQCVELLLKAGEAAHRLGKPHR